MTIVEQTNSEQATLWNGSAASAWIELQAVLDQALGPLETLLVDEVRAQAASRILDVGCGTGATTLAVARSLGAAGDCTGIDISDPMIGVARSRAAQEGTTAGFISADAQTFPFQRATFDMIISRFGIMFFDDSVKAFANLRGAVSNGAALALLTWRSPPENPFMTAAERAAAPLLPDIPQREPDAPGQFAFADARRVTRILEESGWDEIVIEPVDVPCSFPEKELGGYFTQMGPLGRILHEVDPTTRTRIIEKVRTAFEPFVRADEVRFTAACWMVRARSTSH